MTVDTPFPQRPATPFWDPRGRVGMAGLGVDASSVLNAITQGSIAAQRSLLYGQPGYGGGVCPIGTIFNMDTGTCQPGGTVSASASSGVWILVAIGLGLYLFGRGQR